MSKKYNNQDPENEKELNDANEPLPDSDNDNFTFVPVENIQAIERVIKNWEEVKYEWNNLKKI